MEKLWKLTAKQSQEVIKDAVSNKYGISSPPSNISTLFSIKKL